MSVRWTVCAERFAYIDTNTYFNNPIDNINNL